MLPSTPDAQIRPIRQVNKESPPRHLCAVRESNIAIRISRFDESKKPEKEGEFLLESNTAAIGFWERRRKDLDTQEGEFSTIPYLDVSEESNDQSQSQDVPLSKSLRAEFYVLGDKSGPDIVIDSAKER